MDEIKNRIEIMNVLKGNKELLGQAVIAENITSTTISQSNFLPDRNYLMNFDEVKEMMEKCTKKKYGENIEITYSPVH